MSPDDRSPAPDSDVPLADGVTVPKRELRYTFVRGTGPGGQAVNKLATTAQLHVTVTAIDGLSDAAVQRLRRLAGRRLTQADEILLESRVHRSQLDNKNACLDRLRTLVERAKTPPKIRRKSKPTKGSIERRLSAKKQKGEKKQRRKWKGDE